MPDLCLLYYFNKQFSKHIKYGRIQKEKFN